MVKLVFSFPRLVQSIAGLWVTHYHRAADHLLARLVFLLIEKAAFPA